MPTVVTFGEIMLRLSTPGFQRLAQAHQLDVTFGGGEANVAASLAQFGHEARFVSRLPAHAVGEAALGHLRRYNVDTRFVARGGDRVGVYFLETGASQRPSLVVYDRAHSAVAEMQPGDVDWDAALGGAEWFHWTGITPALGASARACLHAALEAAHRAGATVSCDLNYRKKLWTVEEARATMNPLMDRVHVCIANEEDADKSLGLTAGTTDVTGAHLDREGYDRLAERLRREYGFRAVAITLRESHSASDNGWSGLLLGGAGRTAPAASPVRSRRYEVRLVDRVGGGDAFAAGLIHGLLTRDRAEDALGFAVAASAFKQTIPGDFNVASAAEIEKLAAGDGSGRVER